MRFIIEGDLIPKQFHGNLESKLQEKFDVKLKASKLKRRSIKVECSIKGEVQGTVKDNIENELKNKIGEKVEFKRKGTAFEAELKTMLRSKVKEKFNVKLKAKFNKN